MPDDPFAGRKHGRSSTYSRGCRCEECRADNSERSRRRRRRLAGKVILFKFEHGVTGYMSWGCRCDACVSARSATYKDYWARNQEALNERQNDRRRENREKARRDSRAQYAKAQSDTLDRAERHGQEWTSRELEILSREDLTHREAARLLGRTYASVSTQRRLLSGRKPTSRNVRTHGVSGYGRGCKCPRCREAKREYDHSRGGDAKLQAATLGKATRLGSQWTGPELEVAARNDLSITEIATLLGRSYAAVRTARYRLKADPKFISIAGLPTPAPPAPEEA